MNLSQYARNEFSQTGEDGIIAYLVGMIRPSKFCVEFGAWDGVAMSNTRALAMTGWSSLMIEANEAKFAELDRNCKMLSKTQALKWKIGLTAPDTIDNALNAWVGYGGEQIGVMSIDIDGADYHIWDGMVARPQILIIEHNPTIPKDVAFVQARNMSIHHGSSLLSLVDLGKKKGYELVATTSFNAIFVRSELKVGTAVGEAFAAHKPVLDGRIFQGYDGTIFVVGMDKLLWLDIPVTSDDFQILPRSAREWRG